MNETNHQFYSVCLAINMQIFCQENTSVAYIQIDFRLDFIREANTMNPDQTAPLGSVWSGFMLFAIYGAHERADNQNKRADWREKC